MPPLHANVIGYRNLFPALPRHGSINLTFRTIPAYQAIPSHTVLDTCRRQSLGIAETGTHQEKQTITALVNEFSPCFQVAELLCDHFSQIYTQAVHDALGQVHMGRSGKHFDVRHSGLEQCAIPFEVVGAAQCFTATTVLPTFHQVKHTNTIAFN